MLRSEGQRFPFAFALWLLTVVFAVASFFTGGILGWILAVPAVLVGAVASFFTAFILDSDYGPQPLVLGIINAAAMLLAGCLMFSWWGLAYAAVGIVLWLVGHAIKG